MRDEWEGGFLSLYCEWQLISPAIAGLILRQH